MRRGFLVFLLAAAWFAAVIPWNGFPDPDAFYHAHAAMLVWQSGPIKTFSSLDLTILGTTFADQHFLFHVIEAPFVGVFGWANGARIICVILSALCIATFYLAIRWIRIRHAEAWAALLILSQPLLDRLLLAKASPLALLLFLIGLTVVWKRKPFLAVLVAALFALSHGGWIFLLGCAGLMMIGDALFARWVLHESWSDSIRGSPWKETLAVFIGVILGTVIHPNFPQNVSFLWVQIVKIGLETPFQHVILGREWKPADVPSMIASFAPWIIAFIGGIGGIVLARREPIDKVSARAAVVFVWPVVALVAFTLKSRRNAEYLAIAMALWIPWLWNMFDPRVALSVVKSGWSRRRQMIIGAVVVVALTAALGKEMWEGVAALHESAAPDAEFVDVMAPVSARANPGDRVFHSDWDEFPVLWNIDDRLRYVAGMDPTFLYEASSTLSDAYRDLTWLRTSSTRADAWSFIHDRINARFVFIARSDHEPLAELLKTDPRYHLLAESADAVTFEVVP